jgi:hypothetical protein
MRYIGARDSPLGKCHHLDVWDSTVAEPKPVL